MNWQALIVGIIVLLAVIYAGNLVWKRVKSFSPKSGCGGDCGCDTKAKTLAHPLK